MNRMNGEDADMQRMTELKSYAKRYPLGLSWRRPEGSAEQGDFAAINLAGSDAVFDCGRMR
jgi:hypothetical protein